MICKSSSRALVEIPLVESESRSPPCRRQVRPAIKHYGIELNTASTLETVYKVAICPRVYLLYKQIYFTKDLQ